MLRNSAEHFDEVPRGYDTEAVRVSPLAARPYDRHACVSTRLASGVDATQVAKWAGHSVDVLMKVYAKCLDDREDAAMRRIEATFEPEATNAGA